MADTIVSRSAGEEFSAALDPHRRQSMVRALDAAFADWSGKAKPSVALVGWQAATLVDAIYERAGRVVIIEDREELVDSIQKSLAAHNYGKKIKLVAQSPAEVRLDEPVDVAVAAVTSTWFIEGDEARILENVRDHVLVDGGQLVPRRLAHLFEVAAPPTGVSGITLRAPRHSRPGEPVPVLSESKHFISWDPSQGEAPEAIDDTIIVKPLLSGRISALRLTTLVELAEGVVQVTSQAGLQSILVPLREDVDVAAGQPVRIHIRYRVGQGLDTARFSAKPLPPSEAERDQIPVEVLEGFRDRLRQMVRDLDRMGRGADLDKVVSYTVEPHGDVSRLTALFWTIDEEFRKPVKEMVDTFRAQASQAGGPVPGDEAVYDTMIEIYREMRGDQG